MKTVQDIDKWFNSEVDEALKEIPEQVLNLAKIDNQTLKIVSESIARKKCFNPRMVLRNLKKREEYSKAK